MQVLNFLTDFKEIEDVTCLIGKGGQANVYEAFYKPKQEEKETRYSRHQAIRIALKVSVLPDGSTTADELKDIIKNMKA